MGKKGAKKKTVWRTLSIGDVSSPSCSGTTPTSDILSKKDIFASKFKSTTYKHNDELNSVRSTENFKNKYRNNSYSENNCNLSNSSNSHSINTHSDISSNQNNLNNNLAYKRRPLSTQQQGSINFNSEYNRNGGYRSYNRYQRTIYNNDNIINNHEDLGKTELITNIDDQYTRITTPRQDVLFKKGYLSKPKRNFKFNTEMITSSSGSVISTEESITPSTQSESPESFNSIPEDYSPPVMYSYVDPSGMFYFNPYIPNNFDQYGNPIILPPYPCPLNFDGNMYEMNEMEDKPDNEELKTPSSQSSVSIKSSLNNTEENSPEKESEITEESSPAPTEEEIKSIKTGTQDESLNNGKCDTDEENSSPYYPQYYVPYLYYPTSMMDLSDMTFNPMTNCYEVPYHTCSENKYFKFKKRKRRPRKTISSSGVTTDDCFSEVSTENDTISNPNQPIIYPNSNIPVEYIPYLPIHPAMTQLSIHENQPPQDIIEKSTLNVEVKEFMPRNYKPILENENISCEKTVSTNEVTVVVENDKKSDLILEKNSCSNDMNKKNNSINNQINLNENNVNNNNNKSQSSLNKNKIQTQYSNALKSHNQNNMNDNSSVNIKVNQTSNKSTLKTANVKNDKKNVAVQVERVEPTYAEMLYNNMKKSNSNSNNNTINKSGASEQNQLKTNNTKTENKITENKVIEIDQKVNEKPDNTKSESVKWMTVKSKKKKGKIIDFNDMEEEKIDEEFYEQPIQKSEKIVEIKKKDKVEEKKEKEIELVSINNTNEDVSHENQMKNVKTKSKKKTKKKKSLNQFVEGFQVIEPNFNKTKEKTSNKNIIKLDEDDSDENVDENKTEEILSETIEFNDDDEIEEKNNNKTVNLNESSSTISNDNIIDLLNDKEFLNIVADIENEIIKENIAETNLVKKIENYIQQTNAFSGNVSSNENVIDLPVENEIESDQLDETIYDNIMKEEIVEEKREEKSELVDSTDIENVTSDEKIEEIDDLSSKNKEICVNYVLCETINKVNPEPLHQIYEFNKEIENDTVDSVTKTESMSILCDKPKFETEEKKCIDLRLTNVVAKWLHEKQQEISEPILRMPDDPFLSSKIQSYLHNKNQWIINNSDDEEDDEWTTDSECEETDETKLRIKFYNKSEIQNDISDILKNGNVQKTSMSSWITDTDSDYMSDNQIKNDESDCSANTPNENVTPTFPNDPIEKSDQLNLNGKLLTNNHTHHNHIALNESKTIQSPLTEVCVLM